MAKSTEVDITCPSLETVRTHKVGVFKELNGKNDSRSIKTVTLPPWLKNGMDSRISIDKNIYDILKNDGTKSRRHSGKRPRWIRGANGEKGKWLCYVRTPNNKGKWTDGVTAKKGYNKKAGRKEGGMAYKIRREMWRVLSINDDYFVSLLDCDETWNQSNKQRPCKRVSCKIVDLSCALGELLQLCSRKTKKKFFSKSFVIMWYRKSGKEFEQDLDDEEVYAWALENETDFIKIIVEKHWRPILARLLEILVKKRYERKEMSDLNIQEADDVIIVENNPEDCSDCDEPDFEKDDKTNQIYCRNCGYIAGIELSYEDYFQDMIKEE